MDLLGVDRVDICPWALREGVILRRLEWIAQLTAACRTGSPRSRPTGRDAGGAGRRAVVTLGACPLPSRCPAPAWPCRPHRSTPRAAPPRSTWPSAWATTASRSWSGPTRSRRRPGRCARWPSCTAYPWCPSTRRRCCSPSGSGAPTRGERSTGRWSWPATSGADTVVLHPPFRWQRDYATDFVDGVALREHDSGIALAVENMFPWRARNREMLAYLPHWDPVSQPYDHVTLDLSHTATAGSDAMEMAATLGPRLRHVHLADGSGSSRDEHLVPGRGSQPCAELLETLAQQSFEGSRRGRGRHPPADAERARDRPRRGARVRPPAPRRGTGMSLRRRAGGRRSVACVVVADRPRSLTRRRRTP